MAITTTDLHDDHEDVPDERDEPVRPFDVFCPMPSPLSGDVDEIVAYMHLIGDRHHRGVTLGRPARR